MNTLVFKKVQEALGFRVILIGAAPVHCKMLEFFMAVDMLLLEMYGMSKSIGPQALSLKSSTRWRTGSYGKSMNGVETRINKPGENGDGEVSDIG